MVSAARLTRLEEQDTRLRLLLINAINAQPGRLRRRPDKPVNALFRGLTRSLGKWPPCGWRPPSLLILKGSRNGTSNRNGYSAVLAVLSVAEYRSLHLPAGRPGLATGMSNGVSWGPVRHHVHVLRGAFRRVATYRGLFGEPSSIKRFKAVAMRRLSVDGVTLPGRHIRPHRPAGGIEAHLAYCDGPNPPRLWCGTSASSLYRVINVLYLVNMRRGGTTTRCPSNPALRHFWCTR